MNLVAIVGPMKSGKSLELIARLAPYRYADQQVLYVQPAFDVRNQKVNSRIGISLDSIKVSNLKDVTEDFDVIGIDEAHMFDKDDASVVSKWIEAGKDVFISGIDVDYQGRLTPFIKSIFELKPNEIIDKQSVCEACKSYSAKFTQILDQADKEILKGLPSVVPEDGQYQYQPRCRKCFIKASS